MSAVTITVHRNVLAVRTPKTSAHINVCRNIPDYRSWSQREGAWLVKPTPKNTDYLRGQFPNADWSPDALTLVARWAELSGARAEALLADKARLKAQTDVDVSMFGMKTKPFAHQAKAFLLSKDLHAFALFMEQGTGKTKVVIDTAAYLYRNGHIRGLLVVAPNVAKANWITDELPIHMPDDVPTEIAMWQASGGKQVQQQIKHVIHSSAPALQILVMNVEALSSVRGTDAAQAFLDSRPCLFVVDESSRIKTPGARRTRSILRLAKLAPYRRIMTGIPVTQGPLDVFTQFKFLDERILGYASFVSFRNDFAIMGGFNGRQIVGYTNVDKLQRLIDPYSFRVLRDECLDLPPKVYQRIVVELTPEQRRLYDQMESQMEADLGEHRVTAAIVLTKMLRLAQITGGFLPTPDQARPIPIPGGNPKLAALLDLIEDLPGKVIVWCRFTEEIDLVTQALTKAYGRDSVARYDGKVKEDDRIAGRVAFQDPGSPVRFFVGQIQTGGISLTLTQAKTVVFFSNDFSYENRVQAEDRAMRIGQTSPVVYVDLVAANTNDTRVLQVLRTKRDVADLVTGDAWRAWFDTAA